MVDQSCTGNGDHGWSVFDCSLRSLRIALELHRRRRRSRREKRLHSFLLRVAGRDPSAAGMRTSI